MYPGRVGVDIVPLRRAADLAAGRTLPRLLTPAELAAVRGRDGVDVPGLAGRLAAKEAVFKLFHAAGPLPWLSTEIVTAAGGWPQVRLRGRARGLAEAAGLCHIDISISHDEPCAIAVAFGLLLTPALTHVRSNAMGSTVSTGIDEVRRWVLARNPGRTSIADDENLIENRLVDSLSFVDLIYTIEAAAGVEIDFERIDVADFQTLSTIEQAFFA
ncbi:holo-ACP synthase [Actinosynnema sp. CA-299493]